MRHKFALQSNVRASNGAGGKTQAWTTVSSDVYGSLELEDEGEAVAGERVAAIRSGRIVARFRSDVTTKMRLTLGSRTFYVTGVSAADESRRTGRSVFTVEERAS